MNQAITYQGLLDECRAEQRQLVIVDRRDPVAVVTMRDPDNLNALSPALCFQLRERLQEQLEDPRIRVVILTGTDPAFCAGGDLNFILRGEQSIKHGEEGAVTIWRWIRHQFGGIARLLTQSDTLVIAAVNGAAAGVGLSFAFASDYLLASEQAELVPAFGRIGLVPEVGSNWHLVRRLGYQKAMELFVSGERLSATRAEALGLVNRVVPHDKLMEEAMRWADQITGLAENVTAMTKTQLRKAADMSWEQAIVMEEFAEPICFSTEQHRRAVRQLLSHKG